MFWPRRSNMASSRLKRWLRWVRKLWRVVWLFRAANSAWRKQKKVTQSKHFQVISLPGRRNEKQRREIWWRKIRSSLVRFSLFVLFCLFVFFALRNKKKIEEETRDCSSVYLIVRTTLQNGTALEGNDFDVPFWKRRIRLRFSFALYNAWEERCTKK